MILPWARISFYRGYMHMTTSVFTVVKTLRVDVTFTEGQEETGSFDVTLNAVYGSTIFTEGT